jgi:hypothetical protein
MRLRNHFPDIAEVQTRGEMITLRIGIEESLVGLNNSHELNIGATQNSAGWRKAAALKKSIDMTVHHANDADSHGRASSGVERGVRMHGKQSEHRHKNQSHNVSL